MPPNRSFKCQVKSCNNKWTTNVVNALTFFKIPDDKKHPEKRDLINQWLTYIGKGEDVDSYKSGDRKRICEEHFNPGWFTIDRHIRMCRELGMTPKYTKALKDGAYPGPSVVDKDSSYDVDVELILNKYVERQEQEKLEEEKIRNEEIKRREQVIKIDKINGKALERKRNDELIRREQLRRIDE